MSKLFPVLVSSLLLSCAGGPKQDKKSPLNVLSGEHYTANEVLGVPILERKIKNTDILGRVSIIDPLAVIPNDLMVQLWQDKKLVAETKAEKTGHFAFNGNYDNGRYQLRVSSSRYAGEHDLTIDSFRIENVNLTAEKKSR